IGIAIRHVWRHRLVATGAQLSKQRIPAGAVMPVTVKQAEGGHGARSIRRPDIAASRESGGPLGHARAQRLPWPKSGEVELAGLEPATSWVRCIGCWVARVTGGDPPE